MLFEIHFAEEEKTTNILSNIVYVYQCSHTISLLYNLFFVKTSHLKNPKSYNYQNIKRLYPTPPPACVMGVPSFLDLVKLCNYSWGSKTSLCLCSITAPCINPAIRQQDFYSSVINPPMTINGRALKQQLLAIIRFTVF